MRLRAQKIVFCGVARPTTYGTSFIRVAIAMIIVLSVIASVIYGVVLGVDQVYSLHNMQNIYYTPGNDLVNPPKAMLLLPQFDATVGLVSACVGHSCFARAGLSGTQGLIANTLGSQKFTLGDLARLQKRLESEFMFGYDGGVQCGAMSTNIQHMCSFGYGAYVLSLIFFVGVFISSALFCVLVGNIDVLAGTPALDKDSNAVNVEGLDLPGLYLMYRLKRHLIHEGPFLASLLALGGAALVLSACGMGITIAVQSTSSKCGVSVCSSFESSMKSFFDELASFNIPVSAPRAYSCRTGASIVLSIAGFVLGLLCFVLACLLYCWFKYSHRRKDLQAMRDQICRLADVQGVGDIFTGGGSAFPLTKPRPLAAVDRAGFGALSRGRGGCAELDAGGDVIPSNCRGSYSFIDPSSGSAAVFSRMEYVGLHARSVGARIGVYRMLKQFMSSEDLARQGVLAQEKLEFCSLLAMLETVWMNEELCMLHEFTLNWFVGPLLDLLVLETNERQMIIEEFNALERDFLRNLTSDFEASMGADRAKRLAGPLSVAETGRWSRLVAQWQRTQAEMAPLILQSASYARIEASPPLQQQQQWSTRATYESSPFFFLDTDRWITILDGLRASAYDDGAFMTPSAFPLLIRRKASTVSSFVDATSFSSDIFSDPSFAQARCDDFILPDHVRVHLVTTVQLKKTLPRPPLRLRALPQFDRRKQQVSDEDNMGCRRRNGAGDGGGGRSGNGLPGGRSPSPQLRPVESAQSSSGGVVRPFTSAD
ncbi:hypothetical protein ABL78_7463 [Leptomonas seymouri]|uniref:Uncharacterized protein n=1 Tax=Leptomonas seymouri TaxID=5684 RepID=A0A0N1I1X5_LEPSE|nr:hypothetical protein ABL78_7463 [Leptomonas seymouri]|eukprot:KPI83501.1 hypothetical protein ABL78_7463 [Leptomonas seymouri]